MVLYNDLHGRAPDLGNQDFSFKKEVTKSVADKGDSNSTNTTCRSTENVQQMYFLRLRITVKSARLGKSVERPLPSARKSV